MAKANLPKFWNYGNYSSNNYGAHCMAFSDANGNEFYFSYQTLVAFRKGYGGKLHVHENIWGTTTGKHLTWIDGGNKKSRLSAEDFEKKFQELFGDEKKVTVAV